MTWWICSLLIFGTLALFLFRKEARTHEDVLKGLSEDRDEAPEKRVTKTLTYRTQSLLDEELFQAGIFKREEKIRYVAEQRRRPLIVGSIVGFLILIFSQSIPAAVLAAFGGVTGGYLYGRRALYLKKRRFLSDINFFLPVVMERLVMTAQAGLDVFSGIRVVSELAKQDERTLQERIDPVTALLERVHNLHERGVSFEEALSQVSQRIENPALRHSFIHLSVAQKEGSELVQPLRELSDATQNYFQETVEEEIAKLPVKATIPLLLTFAGLVIFFMTSPMMQVMKLSSGGFTP